MVTEKPMDKFGPKRGRPATGRNLQVTVSWRPHQGLALSKRV